MHTFVGLAGAALVLTILWDAFETVILPRTITRRLRLTRFFYAGTWIPWSAVVRRVPAESRRERYLSFYGPLSVILIAVVWAIGLVLGFALLQWGSGSALSVGSRFATLRDDVYMSGTTFFTLGLGDVVPKTAFARALTVLEAGTGFAFLAIVISYLPVVYQSFARREVQIALLDAWAGSPPTAVEVLRRLAASGEIAAIQPFLKEWESWCSQVLESHISFPPLAFFRSQHQKQSWLSALTTVLDLAALLRVGIDEIPQWQARLTFAIARHASVDLTQILNAPALPPVERLSAEALARLRALLAESGLKLREGDDADRELQGLRRLYEPYVQRLSAELLMPLPAWFREERSRDNWQTTPKTDGAGHF
jgi:hypothetical protein